jgi:hypothetical protein
MVPLPRGVALHVDSVDQRRATPAQIAIHVDPFRDEPADFLDPPVLDSQEQRRANWGRGGVQVRQDSRRQSLALHGPSAVQRLLFVPH